MKKKKCKCPKDKLVHIYEPDSFPYGDDLEYDKCTICGKLHNMKVK